jgi:hypothetical protein
MRAKDDLDSNMGLENPECNECTNGCEPDAHFNNPDQVAYGNCVWDNSLMKWVQIAVVTSPAPWYKACAPCLDQ